MSLFDGLIDVIEQSLEEETVANGLKIVRIIFKENKYLFYVSS